MIDRINICIGIQLDRIHLRKLGITYKRFKNGIEFTYKNVKFVYYIPFKNLSIETNTHKILEKIDITLSDKKIYEKELNNIINEIANSKGIDYVKTAFLTRVDYYIDITLDEEKLNTYLKLLREHPNKFKRLKRANKFKTSSYLSTKKSQKRINIYDKEKCAKNKLRITRIRKYYKNSFDLKEKEKSLIMETEIYKNIFRLEIQVKKSRLKVNKKKNGKGRILDNYWDKQSMEEEFFSYLENYLYKGNYYKLSTAFEIIQNSNYTKKWKEKLINFLVDVAEGGGVDAVKELRLYSSHTIKTYIEKLNKLKINPITINTDVKYDELENLLSFARKVAKEKYFK